MWRAKVDKVAMRTPGSGSGQNFKEDVFTNYFFIECKNQEKIRFWEFWEQAYGGAKPTFKPPVLAISSNYRPIIVCMEIDDWLNLVKEAKIE